MELQQQAETNQQVREERRKVEIEKEQLHREREAVMWERRKGEAMRRGFTSMEWHDQGENKGKLRRQQADYRRDLEQMVRDKNAAQLTHERLQLGNGKVRTCLCIRN